jgi:hypothetical protein
MTLLHTIALITGLGIILCAAAPYIAAGVIMFVGGA